MSNSYFAWIDQIHIDENGEGHVLLDLIPQENARTLLAMEQSQFFNEEFGGFPSLPLLIALNECFPSEERNLIERIASEEARGAALVVTLTDTESARFPVARLALQGVSADAIEAPSFFIDSIEPALDDETRSINSALNLSQFVATAIQNSGVPNSDPEKFIRWLLSTALDGRSDISIAVYNVGQGNANAVVDYAEHPLIYFDVGAPLIQYNWTRPLNFPRFFDCDRIHGTSNAGEPPRGFSSPVILSHWDYDHWSGVISNVQIVKDPTTQQKVAKFVLDPKAYQRYWIAPDQGHLNLGVTHQELIRRLCSAKGYNGRPRLQYWPQNTPNINFGVGTLYLNNGTSRNDSGLFLCLRGNVEGNENATILLPGDARYTRVSAICAPITLAGLVVSHHGGDAGKPIGPNFIPTHTQNIVCSVGCANPVTGKKPYKHPNTTVIADHVVAGWNNPAYTYDSKASLASGTPTNNYVLTFDPNFSPQCTCGDVAAANMSLVRP